jgi:HlyD family secretion protein
MERPMIRRSATPLRPGQIPTAAVVLLAVGSAFYFIPMRRARPVWQTLPSAAVRRASFDTCVTASGAAQSSQQTVVKCQLENLQVRSRGGPVYAGGASTILEIIPNGTTVQKGDVLCKLDSSEYEELVRVQALRVEQHRAEMIQTDHSLRAAELALWEYSEGLLGQDIQGMRGQVAQAEATLKTTSNRFAWTGRMASLGYASLMQVATDRTAFLQAIFQLNQARTDLDIYRRFRSTRTLTSLRANYENARMWSIHETGDYHKSEAILAHYRDLVERCTIRAPHDGLVIYANGTFRAEEDRWRIEEGASVRQGQELFYFPDLAKMEIRAMLHETIVQRVGPGMPARVRVEGLPEVALTGRVESVEDIPRRSVINEVPYYACRITLDRSPAGLLPGMTAEVEIRDGRRRDVLAIPTEAIGVDRGRKYCHVVGPDRLERRAIETGGCSANLIEVTAGLGEGDTVVLSPTLDPDIAPQDADSPGPDQAGSDPAPAPR